MLKASVVVRPGDLPWPIFAELCAKTPARGNLVPDAYLAAMAIESGATSVTRDRGFARFTGICGGGAACGSGVPLSLRRVPMRPRNVGPTRCLSAPALRRRTADHRA